MTAVLLAVLAAIRAARRALYWVGEFFLDVVLPVLGFMVLALAITGAVLGAGGGLIYWNGSVTCEHALDDMNRAGEYDFWGAGCMVDDGAGNLVPLDNWRHTEGGR
jgi:hypothetical protein